MGCSQLGLMAKHTKTPSYDLLDHRKYQEQPQNLLAIGCDEGGNYYFLDLSPGKFGEVTFQDHEKTDITEGYKVDNSVW